MALTTEQIDSIKIHPFSYNLIDLRCAVNQGFDSQTFTKLPEYTILEGDILYLEFTIQEWYQRPYLFFFE